MAAVWVRTGTLSKPGVAVGGAGGQHVPSWGIVLSLTGCQGSERCRVSPHGSRRQNRDPQEEAKRTLSSNQSHEEIEGVGSGVYALSSLGAQRLPSRAAGNLLQSALH